MRVPLNAEFNCFPNQKMPLSFGIRVLACRDPPGVEMFGSAPQFHAKNFSHVFTHQSQYDVPGKTSLHDFRSCYWALNATFIPGALLNFSTLGGGDLADSTADTLNQLVQGKLEVNIQRNPDGKRLTFGLIARGRIDQTCIFAKPVFNHTKIPGNIFQIKHRIQVSLIFARFDFQFPTARTKSPAVKSTAPAA